MVAQLQSGPCVVIEVSRKNEDSNIVADFRNFCGPMDPVSIYYFNYFVRCYRYLFDVGYCTANQTKYA